MYRYATVEAALMEVNDIKEDARGALRGRLKNLQRLGVSSEAPGKGSRIRYSFKDTMLMALCLEFAQFGIDPTRIAQVKDVIWPHIKDRVAGEHIEEGLVLAAIPNVLTGNFIYSQSSSSEQALGNFFGIFGIEYSMSRWLYLLDELPRLIEERAIIIHVTNLHKDMRKALIRAEQGG